MNFGRKKGGLNRTNFQNKSEKQIKKIFTKHYNNLGKTPPKIVLEGHLNPSNIAKLKKSLLGLYDKAIKKEKKINKDYILMKNKYNKRIDQVNDNVMKGRSKLEQQYIRGEEVFVPHLMNPSVHSDSFLLRKIGNEEFETLQDKQNRIHQLKQQFKKLKNIGDEDLFNTSYNLVTMNFMIEAFQYYNELSSTHFSIIWEELSELSQFELELFTKMQLFTIIERYLGVDAQKEDVRHIEMRNTKSIEGIGEFLYELIIHAISQVKDVNREENTKF